MSFPHSPVDFRNVRFTREEALAASWVTRANTFYLVNDAVSSRPPKYFVGDGVSTLAELVAADAYLGRDYSSGSSFTEFLGLVSQSGTDAPTVVELLNTLGGSPVFSRFGIGQYFMTLNGAFAGNVAILQFGPENAAVGFFAEKNGDNAVAFYSYSNESAGTAADSQLSSTTLWVRVYSS